MIGPIAFTTPMFLWGLLALPVLWFLLRAVPPAPIRRRFPGVVLLLGLRDEESQADRTPWWLLLLRMLLIAAVIVGMAGPVLNPQAERTGSGPVVILLDDTWPAAPDWNARQDRLAGLIAEAGRAGRSVAVVSLSNPEPPVFQAANDLSGRISGLRPHPYEPDEQALAAWAAALDGRFDIWWLSDGLARDSRADLLTALENHGTVTAFETQRQIYGLRPATFDGTTVTVRATRTVGAAENTLSILAIGPDPNGQERTLARGELTFETGETEATLELSLPPELLARVTRFALDGVRSAGAVALTDDSLRRREVAIISNRDHDEGLQLLSPTYYLEKALVTTTTLLQGAIDDMLPANPDVIALPDIATLPEAQTRDLAEWVAQGGTLLRFAGPQVAASDLSRDAEDALMPVRLRAGGRSVGGAMSWGDPKELRPFDQESPFYGLDIPPDVTVSTQVLAQPDPDLSDRVIAALADGTPLVTRKRIGDGQVVFFHVTANAEWSTLPLSGLFVSMLERLAVSTRNVAPDAEDLVGTIWAADSVLTGFGELGDAGLVAGVPGEMLVTADVSADLPPGVYSSGTRDVRIALNVMDNERELEPVAWPASVTVEGLAEIQETPLKGYLIALALALFAVDTLAALWLSGRLSGRLAGTAAVLLMLGYPPQAQAQDEFAILATDRVTFAHVITGNGNVDAIALAGLRGLGHVLIRRTSVEPGPPVSVDLERDDLSFFPILYWPVTPDQPIPSGDAYARLNRYLRTGGMIVFDTRDAGLGGSGTPEARQLRALAAPLDIPPLERVPSDHVLTRTFYLLQDFPGRHASRDVWVEASPPDAELIEGMPFRNLNDGVSPVVIGGNDWAAAWAIDAQGNAMLPVGRGYAGERQREIARRFGINLVMYVLTGNYKSDQVHVPELLERLGQ